MTALTRSAAAPVHLAGALLAACFFVLSACATPDHTLDDAQALFSQGRPEEGLALLQKAADEHPDNRAYRAEYYRRRDFAVAQWLGQADTLRAVGQFDLSAQLYQRVQQYDAANPRAKAGLVLVEADRRHMAVVTQAEDLVQAEKYREASDLIAPVLAEDPNQRQARRLQRVIEEKTAKPAVSAPELKPWSNAPISLELKDVPLRTVFDVLGRATHLNFLFDRDLKGDQHTSVTVRDAPPDEVLRLVLTTNGLERKVLNPATALIYPNTAQKMREYQELAVKSFYISNADVKQTANLIRTILKTRDIFVDDKSSVLVMKDTPNTIRLAEKLIASQDLAEPEVMLEVEVLEVGYTHLLNLGIQYPSSMALSLAGLASTSSTDASGATTTTTGTGTPGVFTLSDWLSKRSALVRLTVSDPFFALNLQQQDGSTNLLANPRIRVQNKQKAKVLIGERVPVITTTAAATGGFLSQSVTYLDVGLKLEVEPQIHLDDDISINLGLEVSSITNTITTTNGATVYQIGTRNANTVLRLRDGETQILAGLINDEDRRSANKVPGLGDMPVLGPLFGTHNNTNNKTEIVLLITPHLIRTLSQPGRAQTEFDAGTELSTSGGAQAAAMGPVGTPPTLPSPPPEQPAVPGTPGAQGAQGIQGAAPGASGGQQPSNAMQPSPTAQPGYGSQTSAPSTSGTQMVPIGGVTAPQ
jgi:general secretion pathway protein D